MRRLSLFVLAVAVGALTACTATPTAGPITIAPPTSAPATDLPATAAAATAPPAASPTTPATATVTTTPTPEASPTPAVTATPDPEEGVGAVLFEDRFDGASGWNWTYSEPDVVAFTRQDGQLVGTMTRSDLGWRISLGPDGATAGEQQLAVAVTPQVCGERDEFGLFFRGTFADNKFDGYIFKLNCAGQARLERMRASTVEAVVLDWTAVPGLQPGANTSHTLLTWMAGDRIRLYVDGQFLVEATDSGPTGGGLGLFLADRTSGGLTVRFDDLVMKAVTVP